ncbi:proline-rich protein 7-like [Scleropages formosus]|uniref:Proline-rich protein 7-like n=1 Tax=Scleropages formosus TaxID=113540 RepID=A0A0P7WK94_SCLFO|nr:proline-rich protein 7-like [Scleropages formosus]
MVMSQGTYTFLACFAGFWLVWALVVMLCCLCSFVQRRLKRRREERLRERCLRALEMEPLGCLPGASSEPPQFCPPQVLPSQLQPPPAAMTGTWSAPPGRAPGRLGLPLRFPSPAPFPTCPIDARRPSQTRVAQDLPDRSRTNLPLAARLLIDGDCRGFADVLADPSVSPPEADVFGEPPCYEEAVQMEDLPPSYSEVLADTRGGTYTKPMSSISRKPQDPETSKAAPEPAFPQRGYSTLIHLPAHSHVHAHDRWDPLGRLLSSMDLNCSNLAPDPQASAYTTLPRGRRTNMELGLARPRLDDTCTLPTAFPVFGRSTAV